METVRLYIKIPYHQNSFVISRCENTAIFILYNTQFHIDAATACEVDAILHRSAEQLHIDAATACEVDAILHRSAEQFHIDSI